ncbi:SpvB/TcaC N-terminal domain-containing protein [Hymenobacter glacieicola]|uniref:Insecticide toxin TcdB middle/N-terminal domain-containing protein n=1 Tax=Hymenobacter glacieicola TaxID=1562124 RepID=A0ABQ1X6N3_9BACT|nr:SpvB/TcaC N-terminal domain-containing protein [Hymenobacter glacieicola]GGG60520.1 hypothetical protein GCM10011378_40680 [Hymenobacter glacieicola]
MISLPKGGGAMGGMGEKFSPDLFTGTGNFSVPIASPPGRNGFQPELTLGYSTGNGNSAFGLGWNLGVPGVMRKTSKGIPRYDDDQDVFILSGAEDLVPIRRENLLGGADGTTLLGTVAQYRPRTEGLFARIEHYRYHDNGPNYWQVRSKDGLISYYGEPDMPVTASANAAILADPENPTHVFAWHLTRTVDPFGNEIRYGYRRDQAQEGPHHYEQTYLTSLRYADYGPADAKRYLVSVELNYGPRPDPFSTYDAGFEQRLTLRCTSICTYTHPEDADLPAGYHPVATGNRVLVKTYSFAYLDELAPVEQQPLNGVSLLRQVQVTGHRETESSPETEHMPPLEFGYSNFQPTGQNFFPVGGELPATSLASPDLELIDLFGHGLPDLVQLNGVARYWRNLGNGVFDQPRTMRTAPAGLQLADPEVQFMDANGDGRADLLVNRVGLAGYFPLRFNGQWDEQSFRRYQQAPSFSFTDPEVKLLDLDGDGITDVLRNGSRLEYFYHDAEKGFVNNQQVNKQQLDSFPNVSFQDPRVRLGRLTAGLQAVALIHGGRVEYWPNLGRGRWGQRIVMHNSPRLPLNYNPARLLLGDVDGDGLDDLIYVDDNRVTLWINRSGNAWSDPIHISGTPSMTDADAVRVTDLLGTGVAGLLWTRDAQAVGRKQQYLFLDLTGRVKPYVLNQMDNNMGALTRVQYTASTKFYQEDQKRPATRWRTPLPFPVQVVHRVEVLDRISGGKMTTEYSYHHGYWDGGEREFRGFGRVDQRDTETFERYHTPGLHADAELPIVHLTGDWEELDFDGRDFQLDESLIPPRALDQGAHTPVAPEHFAPPLETRSWFHLGPVGDEYGDWQELDLSHEYWAGDQPLLERPAAMREMLRTLPRRHRRDAYRALRGAVLRTELYAHDGTSRQHRPYTVTESLSGVAHVVPRQLDADTFGTWLSFDGQLPPVGQLVAPLSDKLIFFAHGLSQRTTQWERGEDPMTQLSFSADYDTYGQARQQVSLAMPRGWQREATAAGALVTHSLTDYVGYDDDPASSRYGHNRYDAPTQYMTDRVARARSFEIDATTTPLRAFELAAAVLMGQVTGTIIGQSLQYYDGPAFQGLPYNELGAYGAPTRSEVLLLTDELVEQAYGGTPLLLQPAPLAWTDEYPEAFRTAYAEAYPQGRAGYRYFDAAPHTPGYYAVGGRQQYDFQAPDMAQPRGLVRASMDALGDATAPTPSRVSHVEYDAYDLLPVRTTDALGHTTTAQYDYRVLQADLVMDPNQNRTAFNFTPLGLLHETGLLGKENAGEGDIISETPLRFKPSTFLEYNFNAYYQDKQPAWVRTTQCEEHYTVNSAADTLVKTEYSDGFGRLLQTRTQAEDVLFGDETFGDSGLPADSSVRNQPAVGRRRADTDPLNVVVSGWQVYDNKGRVVEKYEPFFAQDFLYEPVTEAQKGQRVRMFYDPRGQVVRTIHPDGTEQRVLYGYPGGEFEPELDKLSDFLPSPWETYSYDANDLAPLTHPGQDRADASHVFTPQSAELDPLGRTVRTVDRLHPTDAAQHVVMRYGYDIRGNRVQVTDALGRVSFRHVYDLKLKAGEGDSGANVLWTAHLDGGVHKACFDVVGQPLCGQDAKGAFTLHTYDLLGRPINVWARDNQAETVTRRQHLRYGTGAALNTVGKPVEHYDEAGRLRLLAYDFKGNLLEKERQVLSDAVLLQAWADAAHAGWQTLPTGSPIDWTALDETRLEARVYPTSTRYDGLNRPVQLTLPHEATGSRPVLTSAYNRAGAMEQVALDGELIVRQVAYNARGQRLLLARGNGIMTRYSYDPMSFRLLCLRSEGFTETQLGTFTPRPGTVRQDTAYLYDLAGNITVMHERAPHSGVGGIEELERLFQYDALYRLLAATGRENQPIAATPWHDETRSYGAQSTTAYTQRYQYDLLGNIQQLRHTSSNSSNSFTRQFTYAAADNYLRQMQVGLATLAYQYDAVGNVVQENNTRHFQWDAANQLRAFATWSGAGSKPTLLAQYVYAGGQRVKKLTQTGTTTWQVTVYADGLDHRYEVSGGTIVEQTQLQVLDGQSRLYQRRTGASLGDERPAGLYGLDDHLGSTAVQLATNGNLVSREEYYPFGETSFGGHERQRYRFCGKERDQENGLYYYGMRYYAACLCRFVSVDPLAEKYDFLTSYQYASNRPISFIDLDGAEATAPPPSLVNTRRLAEQAANAAAANGGSQATRAQIGVVTGPGYAYDSYGNKTPAPSYYIYRYPINILAPKASREQYETAPILYQTGNAPGIRPYEQYATEYAKRKAAADSPFKTAFTTSAASASSFLEKHNDPSKEIRIALGVTEQLKYFSEKVQAIPYTAGWSNTSDPWEVIQSNIIALGMQPNVTFHFNLSLPGGGRIDDPRSLQASNKITVKEFLLVSSLFPNKTTFWIRSGSIYKPTQPKPSKAK